MSAGETSSAARERDDREEESEDDRDRQPDDEQGVAARAVRTIDGDLVGNRDVGGLVHGVLREGLRRPRATAPQVPSNAKPIPAKTIWLMRRASASVTPYDGGAPSALNSA